MIWIHAHHSDFYDFLSRILAESQYNLSMVSVQSQYGLSRVSVKYHQSLSSVQ